MVEARFSSQEDICKNIRLIRESLKRMLTFKFNIPVYQPNTVHPSNSLTEFTKHSPDESFVQLSMSLCRVDKVEQIATAYTLYDKAMM